MKARRTRNYVCVMDAHHPGDATANNPQKTSTSISISESSEVIQWDRGKSFCSVLFYSDLFCSPNFMPTDKLKLMHATRVYPAPLEVDDTAHGTEHKYTEMTYG